MRKTGIVLSVVVSLLLCLQVSQASVGETEPNDTLNQATAFRIGENAAGTLMRPPSDGKDFWRFSLDRDARVSLEISPADGLLLGGVYIYGENKSSYASFASSGERRTFTGYLKGGKTYYLELNGQGAAGSYTIVSQAAYPAHEGEREPNDTLDAPVQHSVNSTSAGHLLYTDIAATDSKDMWRFTLERDAKVTLEFSPFEELAIGSAYIYNENESSYASFGTAGMKKTLTTHLKGGKTYYLEVNGTGGKGGSYTLVSRADYPARDAEQEPNDTFDAAAIHTPNTTAYGHLLYTDIARTDTKDMWRFGLDRDAKIVLEITPSDGLTIGSAYLYNENRSSYSSLSSKGNGKAATFSLQGGKTYYVEINGSGSGGYYSLATAVQYPTYGTELKGANAVNDDMANATSVNAAAVYGHLGYTDIRATDTTDYWTFSLRDERCIDFKAEPIEGDLSLSSAYLYLGNKSSYHSFNAEGRGRVLKQCLKPDTYYIQLSGSNSGSYRLTLGGAGLPGGDTTGPGEDDLRNVRGKEMVSNGVLKTALCGWTVVEWHQPADGKGEVSYEADGVRFKSLAGNTRIGIRQDKEAEVSQCRRLVLSATVKVDRQTLTGTGWNGREAPVGIFVSYTDVGGGVHNLLSENPSDPKRMFWHGFTILDPVQPSLSVHGTKVQQGTWRTYRVDLATLTPKPAKVHYIGAEGAGWSPREGVIKDINLICEE